MPSRGRALLQRVVDVKPQELRALGWSLLYVFAILSAYYVLRPIRDEMGVHGGVEKLPWLFTGTLVAMIAVNPLFAELVKRLPRVRFIATAYRFFSVNLLIFAALFAVATPEQNVWLGRAFFVWVSVFNLFVVSVFWALMVDVFDSEQGKRLFGFLAAGATLGAIAGSTITASLVRELGATTLSITHDLASARKIADRVAMIYAGKIVWSGPVSQIDRSGNPFVDQFIHGRAEGPIKMPVRVR